MKRAFSFSFHQTIVWRGSTSQSASGQPVLPAVAIVQALQHAWVLALSQQA
jgi:hypothetical protein